ncbi:MAG: alpha/beta hydrolase [Glaciihabitans sp.]|nr:alpha/beta hydrolase [Glaciihabitans sp.]
MSPLTKGSAAQRNNVQVSGNLSGPVMLFAHGFGGSHDSWRFVTPEFSDTHKIVVFDHVGSGASDAAAYDRGKYDSLHGYADDILEIITELQLEDVIFVGHSVGSMMGVLAANRAPERFSHLVLVGPSPRYVDDEGYIGGMTQQGVAELLDSSDSNYLGWSSVMGPVIMGNADRPELGQALVESFQTVDPAIAAHFARVTFLSDNRRDLADVVVPTLILQSSDDVIAPLEVGEYVNEHTSNSTYVVMTSRGHVPNLSDPAQVAHHIRTYLA